MKKVKEKIIYHKEGKDKGNHEEPSAEQKNRVLYSLMSKEKVENTIAQMSKAKAEETARTERKKQLSLKKQLDTTSTHYHSQRHLTTINDFKRSEKPTSEFRTGGFNFHAVKNSLVAKSGYFQFNKSTSQNHIVTLHNNLNADSIFQSEKLANPSTADKLMAKRGKRHPN